MTTRDEDCDFFILASDGLWDMRSSEEVSFLLGSVFRKKDKDRTTDDMRKSLEKICDLCCPEKPESDAKGLDNITAVLVDLRS